MIRYMLKNIGEEMKMVEGDLPLEAMQKIVGGYLDVVRLPMDIDMWVNDEGLLDHLPLNIVLNWYDEKNVQPIVGNVFFAGHDENGNTVSLNDSQVVWLIHNLNPHGRHINNMDVLVYKISII